MQGSKDLINNSDGIKVEPTASTHRLPSLKPPRDLSLSAFKSKLAQNANQMNSKKKIYAPNLNVQRNRPRENAVIKQESKEVKAKAHANSERGRGRGRKNNLIQLNSGLFSEGLAPSLKSNRYGRSSSGGGDAAPERSALQKPKLSKHENININKAEEDMMLNELLQDNFIDDPNLEPDYENSPIRLPLYESSLFTKDSVKKIKTEPGIDDEDDKCKGDFVKKIKVEPGLEDDIKEKFTEIKLNIDSKKVLQNEQPKLPSIKEIMSVNEPRFILLQMPTCMPGLKPEGETRQSQPAPQVNGPSSSNNSSNTTDEAATNPESESQCTLQNLKPGKIGKMQVLKSGRVRFILGDTPLLLEMGTQVSFKQELVSVDLDQKTKTGNTICMGSIPLRMTVVPDWEKMIKSQTVF